ncbi:hypothetical protein LCGC14_1009670 [marine sediment metagenome]|uniref:Uncharacterized protein n=1 Tax=marine sediment metagenome TaxID=412755 RepID=A0A0F9N544_9ZZZZ|nr:hypothetical protein [Pricia sp.]
MASKQKGMDISTPTPKAPVVFERKEPNLKVKQTGPGVMTIDIGTAKPSRPQNPERMGVAGIKARERPKGYTNSKAANPKDPGAFPMPSTTIHNPTTDKNAMRGYVVGHAWPQNKTRQGAGPNPYRSENNANNPSQAEATQAQDMAGPV